ncbi:MAG TPA: DUF2600 family protein [Conexibacter sp.]|nr:DUF2600 family protein [Conexibacter sp.]
MLAAPASLATYLLAIVPRVRTELGSWERVAAMIPNPALRAAALAALREKALNAEAAAVFATLVPRKRRSETTVLLVAFQTLTDYLDTISEQPAHDPLSNGIELHRALVDALRPAPGPIDYYRHHPHRDDGGYVELLARFCRERFHALPAAAAVHGMAQRAARRCGEGQSHTHAALHHGSATLAAWARSQTASGYHWWEIAAGASSSVAILALIAAAADPCTTHADAQRIDAAYFPSVGALTVLLDNLIDRDQDAVSGYHNYLGYYATGAVAACRLANIAERAERAVRSLRRSHRHAAIVAGVAGFYLSASEAHTPFAAPIRARVLDCSGDGAPLILALMRLRRRLAERSVSDSRGSGSRNGSPHPIPRAGSRARGSHPRPSASARGA